MTKIGNSDIFSTYLNFDWPIQKALTHTGIRQKIACTIFLNSLSTTYKFCQAKIYLQFYKNLKRKTVDTTRNTNTRNVFPDNQRKRLNIGIIAHSPPT